jgi:hypothetical protein
VEVFLDVAAGGALRAGIVSNGDAASWNSMAAVTHVMLAVERALGAIVAFAGRPRADWRLWLSSGRSSLSAGDLLVR